MLDAALGEILTTCAKMDWLINHGERYLRPEKRHSSLLMFYKSSYVYYEPLGVVAAIVSWNYRPYFYPLELRAFEVVSFISSPQCMVAYPRCSLCW